MFELQIRVKREPGALVRALALIERRGFELHDLDLRQNATLRELRVSIVPRVPGRPLLPLVNQLKKQIDVLEVTCLATNGKPS